MLPIGSYQRTPRCAAQLFLRPDPTGAVHMPKAPPTPVADAIRHRLAAALAPSRLELIDESALHAGHAGARAQGESHFRVLIVAAMFAGKTRLDRQRMVFAALADLMRTDVHALSITALTPEEAGERF
jgi:BolA family transcriptional regulator, general stress-responsive regulator